MLLSSKLAWFHQMMPGTWCKIMALEYVDAWTCVIWWNKVAYCLQEDLPEWHRIYWGSNSIKVGAFAAATGRRLHWVPTRYSTHHKMHWLLLTYSLSWSSMSCDHGGTSGVRYNLSGQESWSCTKTMLMSNTRTSPNKDKVLMLTCRMAKFDPCSRQVGIPWKWHHARSPHDRGLCMITVFSRPLMEKFLAPVTIGKLSGEWPAQRMVVQKVKTVCA